MLADTIVERTRALADRVAASEGMEVVEVEFKGGGQNRILRIFIDKPAGVTLADCETLSHQVSVMLDVEDLIPWRYTLEVSSPGLDRKLLKASDYQRFAGRRACVRLHEPIEGRSQFTGRLAGCDQEQAELELDEGGHLRFELRQVASARLVIEV